MTIPKVEASVGELVEQYQETEGYSEVAKMQVEAQAEAQAEIQAERQQKLAEKEKVLEFFKTQLSYEYVERRYRITTKLNELNESLMSEDKRQQFIMFADSFSRLMEDNTRKLSDFKAAASEYKIDASFTKLVRYFWKTNDDIESAIKRGLGLDHNDEIYKGIVDRIQRNKKVLASISAPVMAKIAQPVTEERPVVKNEVPTIAKPQAARMPAQALFAQIGKNQKVIKQAAWRLVEEANAGKSEFPSEEQKDADLKIIVESIGRIAKGLPPKNREKFKLALKQAIDAYRNGDPRDILKNCTNTSRELSLTSLRKLGVDDKDFLTIKETLKKLAMHSGPDYKGKLGYTSQLEAIDRELLGNKTESRVNWRLRWKLEDKVQTQNYKQALAALDSQDQESGLREEHAVNCK